MPRIIFHPDVVIEVRASYEWYQQQAEGLGDDFLDELESAYDAIGTFPDTWPRFGKFNRRFLLGRFPFSVIYRENEEDIFVVAVMHNSRRPGYWKGRS